MLNILRGRWAAQGVGNGVRETVSFSFSVQKIPVSFSHRFCCFCCFKCDRSFESRRCRLRHLDGPTYSADIRVYIEGRVCRFLEEAENGAAVLGSTVDTQRIREIATCFLTEYFQIRGVLSMQRAQKKLSASAALPKAHPSTHL